MSEEALGLDPRWRQRIKDSGMDLFVKQEMIRLGFWRPGENLSITDAERKKFVEDLEKSYKYLSELRAELKKVNSEIASLGDVKALMKIARQRRIERVAKEREEREQRKANEQALRQEADRQRRRVAPPHLGRAVSSALIFQGGDASKIHAAGLPVMEDVSDLASLLETDEGDIAWLAYHRKAVRCEHYSRFVIPKRSGGERIISAPKPKLKLTQNWINREILGKITPEPTATAFRTGASILDNAQRHCGKGIVIRLDISNFFPTYTFPRVRGLFESFGYNPGIATVLGLLCTEAPRVQAVLHGESWFVATGARRLPQGAPTSPALSNILARRLDRRLSGLTTSIDSEWVYSRYADDMVFSHPDDKRPVGSLIKSATRIIADEGLALNDSKTAVMRRPHRQIVTGLVVNNSPRIPRKALRNFRALLHRCDTQGFDAVSGDLGMDALAHARGYLAFVHMVMPRHAEQLKSRYQWLTS